LRSNKKNFNDKNWLKNLFIPSEGHHSIEEIGLFMEVWEEVVVHSLSPQGADGSY
jgi:hypothetical protein